MGSQTAETFDVAATMRQSSWAGQRSATMVDQANPSERHDSTGRESAARHEAGGGSWSVFHWFSRQRGPDDDERVRTWKRAWITGAEARWSGASPTRNPHRAGSAPAAAWRAGWHWADQQPDRRDPSHVRFAHPRRRATDHASVFAWSMRAGVVGLSVLAFVGCLWQSRRRDNRSVRSDGPRDETSHRARWSRLRAGPKELSDVEGEKTERR